MPNHNKRPNPAHFLLGVLSIIALTPAPAYAYLDPGTGSLIVQMIIAGVATSMFVIRQKWAQIKAVFSNRSSVASATTAAPESTKDTTNE